MRNEQQQHSDINTSKEVEELNTGCYRNSYFIGMFPSILYVPYMFLLIVLLLLTCIYYIHSWSHF